MTVFKSNTAPNFSLKEVFLRPESRRSYLTAELSKDRSRLTRFIKDVYEKIMKDKSHKLLLLLNSQDTVRCDGNGGHRLKFGRLFEFSCTPLNRKKILPNVKSLS